jgi:two-component system OmpR family sensor kinase
MRRWIDGFSVRGRITAGTLAIGFIVSVVAGILLYADVASIIHTSTIQLLHNDLAPLEVAIKRAPTDPDTRAGEGQLVALIDPSGKLVVSNLPDSLNDRFSELKNLQRGARTVGTRRNDYLVMSETIHTSHGAWTAIVARSLQPGDLVLGQLETTLIIGALVLFASFGLASWILSGAALRPVSRMRREAERLGHEDATGTLPVGRARDELAALALTLNEFLDRNRQSVERERQMVSDASHELRTPLAVLVAQLDEATRITGDRAAQLRAIANASQTANRLSRLATNLLELSKLDANQTGASSTWSELAREISLSTDRARIVAHPRRVVVDFDYEETGDADRFDVSATNFGRLVDNLFANSVAASSRGGTVQASLVREASALSLTVRDHGSGVPEEFIGIAFDRFSRVDQSRPTQDGGSGLGLAIVAGIVAQAHGSVQMSNLNPGLMVRVDLPVSGSLQ